MKVRTQPVWLVEAPLAIVNVVPVEIGFVALAVVGLIDGAVAHALHTALLKTYPSSWMALSVTLLLSHGNFSVCAVPPGMIALLSVTPGCAAVSVIVLFAGSPRARTDTDCIFRSNVAWTTHVSRLSRFAGAGIVTVAFIVSLPSVSLMGGAGTVPQPVIVTGLLMRNPVGAAIST